MTTNTTTPAAAATTPDDNKKESTDKSKKKSGRSNLKSSSTNKTDDKDHKQKHNKDGENAPVSPKKEHHQKNKHSKEEASEPPKKEHHKKNKDDHEAPESPKKEHKKKADPTKEPELPKKDSKTKKKSRRNSIKAPKVEGKDAEEKNDDVYVDEETQTMMTLLTEDLWSATTAEATAKILQRLYELAKSSPDRATLSLELGAPLLVARRMKDPAGDTAVQSAAMSLWHHWAAVAASSSAVAFYRLSIRVDGLSRVQDILTNTNTTDTPDEAWLEVQESALHYLETMASSSEAIQYLIRYQGVETLCKLFGQCHRIKDETLLPRVSDLLYLLATKTGTEGRDKVVAELGPLLSQDRAEPGAVACQTAVLDWFGKMLQDESIPVGLVPTLISTKVWERLQEIMTEGSEHKERSPEMAELQDKAMGLYETMAASNSETATLLLNNRGVETCKVIVKGKNGALIPRALEVLFQLSATTDTDGRCKITEEMGELLRDSPYELLQTAIISLLSEMAKDEETAKGLLRGQGVESLVYTWETYHTDRPAVSDKALDLLVLLAAKGGEIARKIIIDNGVLTTVAKTMKDEPANDTIHTRGRQLAQALAKEHGPAVDRTGILAL